MSTKGTFYWSKFEITSYRRRENKSSTESYKCIHGFIVYGVPLYMCNAQLSLCGSLATYTGSFSKLTQLDGYPAAPSFDSSRVPCLHTRLTDLLSGQAVHSWPTGTLSGRRLKHLHAKDVCWKTRAFVTIRHEHLRSCPTRSVQVTLYILGVRVVTEAFCSWYGTDRASTQCERPITSSELNSVHPTTDTDDRLCPESGHNLQSGLPTSALR